MRGMALRCHVAAEAAPTLGRSSDIDPRLPQDRAIPETVFPQVPMPASRVWRVEVPPPDPLLSSSLTVSPSERRIDGRG